MIYVKLVGNVHFLSSGCLNPGKKNLMYADDNWNRDSVWDGACENGVVVGGVGVSG